MAEIATTPMIYGALANVMAEIGAIGKNKRNSQQGFMYRGVDDVMNALNPILVKNRVILTTEVLEQTREERQTAKGGTLLYSICKIRFTFFAEDGSNVSSIILGEGMDSGDKASNKAMSVAYKYAFFQMFCIPTEEMADPDSESHDLKAQEPKPVFTPASLEQIKKMNDFVDAYADMCENATSVDIWNNLKAKYKFSHTSDISSEMADKIIEQVETWYKKKKEADA